MLSGFAAAAGLAVWAFWPEAVQVDLAVARTTAMQVTVAGEGVTRVRDRYQVMAPLAGTVTRAPVQVGDAVIRGETVVAVIQPAAPAFLDTRARAQTEAAVAEAEAALRMAEANLLQAHTDLTHAESTYARNSALAARGIIASGMLEDVDMARARARAAMAAAQSSVDLQRATLVRMQAQLQGPVDVSGDMSSDACCVALHAPQSGTVLAVENPSSRPVQVGAPLLTIGDLGDLEIEVDLLSSDAVRIAPGARAMVERWGGDAAIDAIVRRVDPAAYTRISALGIEEQRVRLRLDILTPPNQRPGLGDNYRVFVRVVIWEAAAALQVPVGALFRVDGQWAVFREANRRAVMTPVTVGRKNGLSAQILAGLAEGDRVVAFPGNRVEDGTRLVGRTTN